MSPPLAFRAGWREIPAARPVTQEHLAHPDLALSLHGPGAAQLKKSHHDEIPGDPWYLWSGACAGAWAISLRHRDAVIDLSAPGAVRWRARQSGTRRLRLILKPERGRWLVSDLGDGASGGWREFEIEIATTSWRRLDIETVTPGGEAGAGEIDMGRVDAVGVTDLMGGEGSGQCSRLDWIEVSGRLVARTAR
ncbi:MAG: hypothetical protein HY049_03060 [Acidobacteria bacterium]|nr:hypothetical protein [Acidobacteriota bacterium]